VCESCTEIRAGNCVDVIEIDAATNRGIDEIRELREATRYRPARDRFKIYILDEAHQITDAAFNALLKTLEEPPSHVVFMMATTQAEDIPQTIRSRCQHFSFRAVGFEEIVGQLRDLIGREGIAADEDALALLAEAGDGSMRDALSILDQAIVSCDGRLTGEGVRQLVGAAPSGVFEEIMQAVERGASDEILRQVDRLMGEGQNPAHFARQMVRFLRNAIVAKVAGVDSPLLQISPDDRRRVARIAEHFSEEDLTRHLHIMLRTHSELGYRQEQRFHLELGLLKMSHAQRLLPIEQLLSEAALPSSGPPRAAAKPSLVPDIRPSGPRPPDPGASALEPAARPGLLSPFAADSARKGGSNSQLAAPVVPAPKPRSTPAPAANVIFGSSAPATVEREESTEKVGAIIETSPPGFREATDSLRDAVRQSLEEAGHPMLGSMLEAGEWQLEGNEVRIKVPASEKVIDMSLSAETKRLLVSTANRVLARPIQLKVLPGTETPVQSAPSPPSGPRNGRSRAEQDPVVRRMREKFGAEIRTIIDYREQR
jgi:DNA polymerase-3 subunit gamma/tau